eukprot:2906930-Prymnesium_polylepis.1
MLHAEPVRSLGWWVKQGDVERSECSWVGGLRGCDMVYHAQGTLGGVWVTLCDPQTTFLMLHGEPES